MNIIRWQLFDNEYGAGMHPDPGGRFVRLEDHNRFLAEAVLRERERWDRHCRESWTQLAQGTLALASVEGEAGGGGG